MAAKNTAAKKGAAKKDPEAALKKKVDAVNAKKGVDAIDPEHETVMPPPAADPMRIWDQVKETDPDDTKKVSIGYTFTAIKPHSQIMEATKLWGPMGFEWGADNEMLAHHPEICIVKVTLWYVESGVKCHVEQFGACTWKKGQKIDDDAPKKAATDGLTKCLSLLGFNADVFHGLFDDSKYLAHITEKKAAEKKEAKTEAKPPAKKSEPASKHASKADATKAAEEFEKEQQQGSDEGGEDDQRSIAIMTKADLKKIGERASLHAVNLGFESEDADTFIKLALVELSLGGIRNVPGLERKHLNSIINAIQAITKEQIDAGF